MNRRSFLTRLAALLASVPLLRLRGEAKAATTVPSRPLPTPFDAETLAALNREAARADDIYAQMFDPNVKWADGDQVWVNGRRYEYLNGYWFGRSAMRESAPPTIYFGPPAEPDLWRATTPPRDGGWM